MRPVGDGLQLCSVPSGRGVNRPWRKSTVGFAPSTVTTSVLIPRTRNSPGICARWQPEPSGGTACVRSTITTRRRVSQTSTKRCASTPASDTWADFGAAMVAVPVASTGCDPTVVEFRTNSTVDPGGALVTMTVWAVAAPAAMVRSIAPAMSRRHGLIVFGCASEDMAQVLFKTRPPRDLR